jgi:hypothetical protein
VLLLAIGMIQQNGRFWQFDGDLVICAHTTDGKSGL